MARSASSPEWPCSLQTSGCAVRACSRPVPGLRSTTALFLLLTLLPAAILAWLGLRASAPLVEELRLQARSEAARVAGQEAAAVQAKAAARTQATATSLAA